MDINSFINFLIILIISIFNLSNTQNIITSWHYDKVQMYEMETIGDMFTYENLKDITFGELKEDFITINNLKISDVSHSLYDSYLNFKTGLILLTPDKVSLSFTFNYTFGDITSNASFDFKINIIRIKYKNNKEEQTQAVNISGEFSDTDFSVYDISDKILSERVRYAIYKGFKNNYILNGTIFKNIDIIQYYKNRLSKKPDFVLKTGTFLGQKEININLNRFVAFCEDVEGKLKTALCYYSGEIDNVEDKTDHSQDPLKKADFLNSTDTYNTFININLLNKIAQKISTEGISQKTYDKTVPKKSLSYDFTVASLKKFFNGLDAYDNALEFSASIKISEFDTKSAKFNANFNIGENQNVFSINVELNFGLEFSLKKNIRLNLCLNNVSNIKVTISTGSVTIKDEAGLVSAIQESFDFGNIPICLSDNGVSFRDYYSKIKNVEASEEGFYIFGDQLYQ